MAKKMYAMFIAMVAVMAITTSCSKDEAWGIYEEPENPVTPTSPIIGWKPMGDVENDSIPAEFVRENGESEYGYVAISMSAQDTIYAEGVESFVAIDDLAEGKAANVNVSFKYNYDKTNILTIDGLKASFKADGKIYQNLPCLEALTVVGKHNVVDVNNNDGFYEVSETAYTLISESEYNLASAVQVFVVDEGYVAPEPEFDHTVWSYDHLHFVRNAQNVNGQIIVVCNNVANFKDIWTDNTEHNVEEVNYNVNNTFNLSVPAIEVENINNVIGQTYNVVNGVANIEGTNIRIEWVSSAVVGEVKHNDVDYASEITPCKAKARTITINSASEATIVFYDDNADDNATATISVAISEEVTLVNILRNFVHRNFVQNASVSGSGISVVCNNEASFVKQYSDGSEDAAVTVDYTVTNNFNYSMPMFTVNSAADIIGVSAEFTNGTAVIAGRNVTINFVNREISAIMFDGTDYRNEAPQCAVTAKSIEIISADQAVIRFAHNGNVVATATVPVELQVVNIIPGDVVSIVVTDHYNGRQLMGVGVHARRADGTVYSFELGSNVNNGTVTTTSVQGTYAWYYYQGQYHLGTVEATHITDNGAPTEWVIWYYTLDGQPALALGYAEATLNGQGFRNPIHTVTLDNNVWSVTVNGNTHYFASQN